MSYWDLRALRYQDDYDNAPVRCRAANIIVTEVQRQRPSSLIDIGGGQGHLAELIKQACPDVRVLLVDSSAEMLAAARQRLDGYGGVEAICADFSDLSFIPDGHVDMVISTFALHHINDAGKRATLKEAYRVLQENGRLLIADEVICDPNIFGDHEQTMLAMMDVFYPGCPVEELRPKFDGLVEYPTDLTNMAQIALDAGFLPTMKIMNRMSAIIDGEKMC